MDWEDINSPDDLTVEVIKQYMRIEHDLDDFELQMYLKSALSYARKYVRMEDTDTPLDVDLIMPVLMMVSHFYENKTVEWQGKNTRIYDSILNLGKGHSL